MKEITQDIQRAFHNQDWHNSETAIAYRLPETAGERAARLGRQIRTKAVPPLSALAIGIASCASPTETEIQEPTPIVEKEPSGMPSQTVELLPEQPAIEEQPPERPTRVPTSMPATREQPTPKPTETSTRVPTEKTATPTVERLTIPPAVRLEIPPVEQLAIGGANIEVFEIGKKEIQSSAGPILQLFLPPGETSQKAARFLANGDHPLGWWLSLYPKMIRWQDQDGWTKESIGTWDPFKQVVSYPTKDGESLNFVPLLPLERGKPALVYDEQSGVTSVAWLEDNQIVGLERPFFEAKEGEEIRVVQKEDPNVIQEVVERHNLNTGETQELKVIWSSAKEAPTPTPEPTATKEVIQAPEIPVGWTFLPDVYLAVGGEERQVGGVLVPVEDIPALTGESSSVFPMPFDPTGLEGKIIIKGVTCGAREENYKKTFVVSCPLGTKVVAPLSGELETIPMSGTVANTGFVYSPSATFMGGNAYLSIHVAPGLPHDSKEVKVGQVLDKIRKWEFPPYIAGDLLGEEGGTWEVVFLLSDLNAYAVDLKEEYLLRYNGNLVFVHANP